MAAIYTGQHILGVFLTGGATNTKPSTSLGGDVSSQEYRELRPIISNPIPGLQILQVFASCEEGDATLAVDAAGSLVFTPPDGDAGTAVAVAAGETKIINGLNTMKGVIVKRFTNDRAFEGSMTLTLVECLNGLVSMSDIANADRISGEAYYRCFALKNQSAVDLYDLKLWVDVDVNLQSTYALASEVIDSSGAVQSIPNETTAPSGLVFQDVMGYADSLDIVDAATPFEPGDWIAVWIRKTFPAAGVVAAEEDVTLRVKFVAEA